MCCVYARQGRGLSHHLPLLGLQRIEPPLAIACLQRIEPPQIFSWFAWCSEGSPSSPSLNTDLQLQRYVFCIPLSLIY
ncbi:hypothetical protein EJB05_22530, partial [Eragrostis curvula]